MKVKAAKEKINEDPLTKPKWMRENTFLRLSNEYFGLHEKEHIAEFFSLRNHQIAEKIFTKYGSVLFVAEVWEKNYQRECA